MLRKILATAAAVAFVAFAFLFFPPLIVAHAQALDGTHIVGLVCAHSTLAAYLLTAFVSGSVLAWRKRNLPAPIVHLANLCGLNWPELLPVAKALWTAIRTPAVPPSSAVVLILALAGFGVLSACSSTADQNIVKASQSLAQGAQTMQTVLVTVQPVASNLACDVQAASNAVGAGAGGTAGTILKGGAANTATQIAIGADTASKISGTFCNNKQQGQELPTPVPVVAGATAVINGVPLPVPVAAVTPATAAPAAQ